MNYNKIIAIILAVMLVVSTVFLGVTTYKLNNKIKSLDLLVGQRMAVIENFLHLATQNENGSVYKQYLEELTKQ